MYPVAPAIMATPFFSVDVFDDDGEDEIMEREKPSVVVVVVEDKSTNATSSIMQTALLHDSSGVS